MRKYPCFATVCAIKASQHKREATAAAACGVAETHRRGQQHLSNDLEEDGTSDVAVSQGEAKTVMDFVNSFGNATVEGNKRSTMLLSVLLDVVVHVSGLFADAGSARENGKLFLMIFELACQQN